MNVMIGRFILISLIAFVLPSEVASQLDIMPFPQSVKHGEGYFMIKDDFNVSLEGPGSHRLDAYVQSFKYRLGAMTGARILWQTLNKDKAAHLTITYGETADLNPAVDESYKIVVTRDKGISLTSKTDIGALRGLETLLQMVIIKDNKYVIQEAEIQDYPRFEWRGLLVDVCRHFIPIDVMKRIVQGMAAVKMNVLHWHLTEDQGFRVESKAFPRLHEKGSDGQYYTQEEVVSFIKFADSYGIRVMPEFDLPGHATSWLVAYPELGAGPPPQGLERYFGVFNPTFDPTQDEVYEFLDGFLGEMSALFKDEFIHIGGDENNGIDWDNNEDIQVFMRDNNIPDNHALQAYFNNRVYDILTRYGKRMIGWDEIMQSGLNKDIVIHAWRGKEKLVEAAQSGYQTILSNGYYIDLSQTAAFHYQNDPVTDDMPLTGEQLELIKGGEATMWSELVSKENIETRIWPRTAAIAERLWSDASVNDVDDMYRRLVYVSAHLEKAGSKHLKNRQALIRQLSERTMSHHLEYFLDWFQPLEGYARHGQKPRYTSYTPLTRSVDATNPDALNLWYMKAAILSGLNKGEWQLLELEVARLKAFLAESDSFKTMIAQNPKLSEIEELHKGFMSQSVEMLSLFSKLQEHEEPEDYIAYLKDRMGALEELSAAEIFLTYRNLIEWLIITMG